MKEKKIKKYKTITQALKYQKDGEAAVKIKGGYINLKTWPPFENPVKVNYFELWMCFVICLILGALFAGAQGMGLGALIGFIGYLVLWWLKYR